MGHEGGTLEKIICCDRGDNNDGWLPAMMMSNNGMNNNPFAWIVLLALMRNNGGLFDGNNGGVQGIELQAQIDSLRSQLSDNQNSTLLMDAIKGNDFAISQLAQNVNCDFKALQGAICDVRAGIQQVSGQVGFSAERVINAVQMGNCNIIQALKDCCCETQKEILIQSNALQRGQDFINRSIERGFSSVAFQQQQDKCDIIRAGQDNTQRIIDTLNTHWKDEQAREIQDLKAQISQFKQTDAIIARLRGSGCGCNDGCNNNLGF